VVNNGRITANKARRVAEVIEVIENNLNGNQEIGEAGDNKSSNSDYKLSNANKEEVIIIKRVINYSLINYQEILSIKKAYNILKEERTAVLDIYRDLRALIYPNYSNNKYIKVAFNNK
jgi:hypothetical protein